MRFTRNQLDKITILDVEQELYERLGTENASVARMNLELKKYKEEYLELIEEQERLEAEKKAAKEEFLKKQKELSEAKNKEEELEKNKELIYSTRWKNLYDSRSSLDKIVSDISNPDAWFRDFCNNNEHREISEFLSKIESIDYDTRRTAEKLEEESKLNKLRLIRNDFLYKTDWTQSVTDSSLDNQTKKEYRLYRKYLRELPILIHNSQVLDFNVMSYDEWYDNRPIFKGSNEI